MMSYKVTIHDAQCRVIFFDVKATAKGQDLVLCHSKAFNSLTIILRKVMHTGAMS